MSNAYWENRYQTQDMPWEKGAPSPGLVDFLQAHPELTRGTVCVPGCGTGHDVRAWASSGFEASGFDLAPSAIRLAAKPRPLSVCGRNSTRSTFAGSSAAAIPMDL